VFWSISLQPESSNPNARIRRGARPLDPAGA
jgi:hypothetical protein